MGKPESGARAVRRVVTAMDDTGRSAVVADAVVAPFVADLLGGAGFVHLWGADGPPVVGDGREPDHAGYFPPPAGFRVEILSLPPNGAAAPDVPDHDRARAEVEWRLPGLVGVMARDGMHATATVDVVVVLDGEAWLAIDGEAEEVHLRAGDCVVQNGARHAWRNHSACPARMLVCLFGASEGPTAPRAG